MSPRWPALMKRATLAEYLDMGETAVVREVAAGRLPPPVMFGGREHWRKDAVDAAIAITGGESAQDHIARFEERRRRA